MTSPGASPVDPSPEDADGQSVPSGLTVSSLVTTRGDEPGLVADPPPEPTGPTEPTAMLTGATVVQTAGSRTSRTRGWTRVPAEATIALLGLACLLVFWKVGGLRLTGRNPFDWRFGPIFDRTTATGGDMGAHVWGPDAVRRNCLPQLRPSCWQNDVYGGMKYPQFYFPGPIWLIVFLSFVIPYAIAFKVVTILGLVLMPVTGWAMGRLAKLDDPLPVLLGLATIPFIFDRQFFIYGGNMLSTMAGEFSFAISLMLGLLFIGLYVRVLRTGRGRAFAAMTLGGMAISHLLPTMWTAVFFVCISAVFVDPKRVRRQVLDAGLVGLCGVALTGFWVIPFRANLDYTNDMGWEKLNQYVGNLFPWLGKDGDPPAPLDGAGIATATLMLAACGALWAFLSFLRGTAPKRNSSLSAAYWPVVGAASLAGAAACIGGFSTVRHALVALLIVVPACAFVSATIVSALSSTWTTLKAVQLILVIAPAVVLATFWPDRFVNNDGHLGLLIVAMIGVIGVVFVQTLSGAEYERFPLAVTMMTAAAGGTFVLAPQFRLWNAPGTAVLVPRRVPPRGDRCRRHRPRSLGRPRLARRARAPADRFARQRGRRARRDPYVSRCRGAAQPGLAQPADPQGQGFADRGAARPRYHRPLTGAGMGRAQLHGIRVEGCLARVPDAHDEPEVALAELWPRLLGVRDGEHRTLRYVAVADDHPVLDRRLHRLI